MQDKDVHWSEDTLQLNNKHIVKRFPHVFIRCCDMLLCQLTDSTDGTVYKDLFQHIFHILANIYADTVIPVMSGNCHFGHYMVSFWLVNSYIFQLKEPRVP